MRPVVAVDPGAVVQRRQRFQPRPRSLGLAEGDRAVEGDHRIGRDPLQDPVPRVHLVPVGVPGAAGGVPPERAGSAASMSETGDHFGGSLGVALIGVVSAGVFHSRVADALPAAAPDAAGRTLAAVPAAARERGEEVASGPRGLT
jgi:hypothetical protein